MNPSKVLLQYYVSKIQINITCSTQDEHSTIKLQMHLLNFWILSRNNHHSS